MSGLLEQLLLHAQKSDCDKIKFAAAALDTNGDVLAFGWNHNPRPGSEWSCAASCVGGIRAGVRSGTCVERCYSIHAEQHALLRSEGRCHEIAVVGVMPDGTIFDNGGGFYCTVCARLMASAGVQRVRIYSNGWLSLPLQTAWDQSYALAVR